MSTGIPHGYQEKGNGMNQIFQKISISLLAAAVSLSFSACAPIVHKGEATSVHNESALSSHYPVTVTTMDSKGEMQEETFDKAPRRVVAVWQNSIETIIALGEGDRIVAGMGIPDARYLRAEYRAQYEKIPYTSLQNLDMETITMMDPDFISGWYSTFSSKVLRSTDYWKERGVNTYISVNSSSKVRKQTVENEYQDILNMGKIFNQEEKAGEIVGEMKDKIRKAEAEAHAAGRHPRGLIVELQGKSLTVYGKNSLAGNILESMGGELLVSEGREISKEQLIALNPDALFLVVSESHYDQLDSLLSWFYEERAFDSVDCIRNHRITVLPLYAVYSAGVRMSDGIGFIGKGLYPDLFRDQKDFT